MTIDRLLTTKTACTDYIGWVGSDFVEQGKRAADAMIKATGGTASCAILLGAAGVNVTTDRNKGFKDQIEPGAPASRSWPSRPATTTARRARRSPSS